MSKQKKPRRQKSSFDRALLKFIDDYVEETGDLTPQLHHVAAWAINKGLYEPPTHSVIRDLAKLLGRIARQDYIDDENGNPVRRRHAWKEKREGKQLTFWVNIEDATPQQMRMSAQGRRRGILADCVQLDRDVSYYNKHHNPGESIQLTFDFGPDVQERNEPRDYPDAPPAGPDDGGDDPTGGVPV